MACSGIQQFGGLLRETFFLLSQEKSRLWQWVYLDLRMLNQWCKSKWDHIDALGFGRGITMLISTTDAAPPPGT